MIIKVFKLIIFSLTLAGCVHAGNQADTPSDTPSQSSQVTVSGRFEKGQPAPKATATSFAGEEIDISQWYGRSAIVIDFWAGWCPFCVAEMPELQRPKVLFNNKKPMKNNSAPATLLKIPKYRVS